MKILILILGYDNGTINNREIICRNTWIKHLESNQQHLFYYGNNGSSNYNNTHINFNDRFKLIADSLYCQTTETHFVLPKTFEVFDYVLNSGVFEFDYILRVCNGSYIRGDKLNAAVQYLSSIMNITNLYCGRKVLHNMINEKTLEYIAGSSILISKNIVKYLVDLNKKHGTCALIKKAIDNKIHLQDDVIISWLLQNINIMPLHYDNFEISTELQLSTVNIDSNIFQYHTRKFESLMYKLEEIFYA